MKNFKKSKKHDAIVRDYDKIKSSKEYLNNFVNHLIHIKYVF